MVHYPVGIKLGLEVDQAGFKLDISATYTIITSMNIASLSSQLKFANRIGQTLSSQEKINLQIAVLKLSQEYHYQEFNFWGRVEGVLKNYYIVEGVSFKGATNSPLKKHFWSSDDFKFAELPAPRVEFAAKVNKTDEYFTGQHEKILMKGNDHPKDIVLGEDHFVRNKSFTELDRLSIVVHQIDFDCQVVPLGAFKIIPTHEIVRNPNFRGLKIDQSRNLDNYVHLRYPVNVDKRLLIESDKALQRQDFLDTLGQDLIKKSWSLQTDESKTEITLRSLIWAGYVGYHRTNSNIYGGVYMGNGIRSQDLPFLI